MRFVAYSGDGEVPRWLAEPAGRPRILVSRSTAPGPGAGTSEFLAHTRGRATVGGYSVPALREAVARDAAAARRDAEAMALYVADDRRRLAADLDLLLPRLRPRRLLRRAAQLRRRVWVAVVLLAALLLFRRLLSQ